MSNFNQLSTGGIDALTVTTGVVVPHVQSAGGCTLTATTFYFPLTNFNAEMPGQTAHLGIQAKWAAAVAGTITVETCDFPSKVGGDFRGAADVTDYDSTAGNWMPFNPTAAESLYVGLVGASNTATALTITAGGAAAGGCGINIPSLAHRRARLKVVLSVGGVVRVAKAGA